MAATADLKKLTLNDFSTYLNGAFEIQGPGGKGVQATLVKAAANGAAAPPKGWTTPQGVAVAARDAGFTLEFKADGTDLPEGCYTVKHPKLGAMELFLVPSKGAGARTDGYVAVFG